MSLTQQCADAIKMLAVEATSKANSGHPGMPMGMSEIATVLWQQFITQNPNHPTWVNRDRFMLSNGHGVMLQYALLHLSGFAVSIDDIKAFRQLHSNTPGHPEFGFTPGVETTTGPLGQGFGNAVGFALAEKLLALEFNEPRHPIVDHHTYVFVGDGCLMEGVSHEAASLAGTWQLNKLIAFYDDNGISIDGKVAGWFTDDTPMRFRSYGWHVIEKVDGHDFAAIEQAILEAQKSQNKPVLICCRTVIGKGSPLAGSEKAHGSAMNPEQVAQTREILNWHHAPFDVPKAVYAAFDLREKGQAKEQAWQHLFADYQKAYPEKAAQFLQRTQHDLPASFASVQQNLFDKIAQQEKTPISTRKASQWVLDELAPHLPEILGGSADLTHSNLTWWKKAQAFSHQTQGNYLYYGVREFGMSTIMNGVALHGGFIPFGGTFLTFLDYCKNAVRLSAIMKQRVIYVFTHDSIGLGEDGPTHQPIEQLCMLRATPNVTEWRPCDLFETAIAWVESLKEKGPSALILSRQNLAQTAAPRAMGDVVQGASIVFEPAKAPEAIFIATGSEVALAIDAAKMLEAKGEAIRVVSMVSTARFNRASADFKERILPAALTCRLAIEAQSPLSWYQYVGHQGAVIGLAQFGESAPADALWEHFGFTISNIEKTFYSIKEGNYGH